MQITETTDSTAQHFSCPACPYTRPIKSRIGSKINFARRTDDLVLGDESQWQNVDQTDATCPKCEHPRAYYMQIQIRSADEPSTIFYRCCNPKCVHQWREG